MADTKTTLPKQSGKAIGASGTLIYQGMIHNEDYNRDFTGQGLIEKVEIMRRSSSTIRGTLLVVKLPILGADWKIKPAANADGEVDPEDKERAAYIERQLFHRNIDFSDFMRQAMTHFDFGYSVFEKVLDLDEYEGKARIGLKELGFRKQRSIQKWEMSDGKPGIHQMIGDGSTFDIPRAKLVIFTNEKEGDNYEGISLLRYAYKDWDILDKLTIVNAIALEKMGIGVPIVEVKDGETPGQDDLDKAEEIMRNFRANEEAYIVAPGSMSVEMMDMKGNTTREIIPTLNYHDSRISKSVLAGFMDIGGQSGSGSQSLSKDLSSLFMKAEEASAKAIQSVIQKDIINQLCDFNFSELPNGYPTIEFGSISDDDLSENATAIGILAEKKLITPNVDTETHIRKQYKLPALSQADREAYEKRQQLADEAMSTLHDSKDDSKAPATTKLDTKDDTLTKTEKTKPDPKLVKASLEEARRKSRAVRGELIDAITY